jgi:hypothetical protein
LVTDLGTLLYVNKLAYLTHLTNADSISDREVQILLGEQPQLDGLIFSTPSPIQTAARSSTAIPSPSWLPAASNSRDLVCEGS